MSDRYVISEFDPATASDDDFRAHWQTSLRISEENEPEDPPTPLDKHKQSLIDQPSYRRPKRWVAWDGERKNVLAYADLELEYVDSNRHLAWAGIGVLPEARRQRIATSLLRHITDAAAADGRTILGAGSIDGSAGDAFCEAMGFEKKATERKSRLAIADVDRSMLEAWVEKAAERASGYELIGFDGRCPDDLLEPFVDLQFVTNTAPRDDLDREDEIPTPERFRESEAKALARGETAWRLIARERETGELAGFTEFFFVPYTEEVVWQGWTAVRETHRNRGLGRWLKAVNCLRLMDEKPAVAAVDTWNAFSNAPMLGINIEMGFQIIRGYNDWQAPTDRLAAAAKQHLDS